MVQAAETVDLTIDACGTKCPMPILKAKKALANPGKINEYVKIFQKYVDTNLSLSDMAWFGQQALSAGMENISFSTLPGEWHSPYIYLDQEETLALVNAHLNPYVEDRTAEDLNILSR